MMVVRIVMRMIIGCESVTIAAATRGWNDNMHGFALVFAVNNRELMHHDLIYSYVFFGNGTTATECWFHWS